MQRPSVAAFLGGMPRQTDAASPKPGFADAYKFWLLKHESKQERRHEHDRESRYGNFPVFNAAHALSQTTLLAI